MTFLKIKLIKSKLSEREKQVLKLICEEKTNLLIGKKLGISIFTVDYHRRKINSKAKSKSIAGLVKYGIKTRVYILK